METVLKFDRVVLQKELNEKFRKVGEVFEVANLLDKGFMLRDSMTKIALGIVSFEDFEKCFVKEEKAIGWTPWTPLAGMDGRTDSFYRTNGKRVQVKFLTDKVRAEASCNPANEFNLFFGIQIAYLRCENKALRKKEEKYAKELKRIFIEKTDNETFIKKMVESLEA